MKTAVPATRQQYDAIWLTECEQDYPEIDEVEKSLGFAIDRNWLESTARVLNCPVKVNAPNWQHGRVIYAVLRNFLENTTLRDASFSLLDIGTAKGFSAVVMARALVDSNRQHISIDTVDVMDPNSRERRNTVVELDGFKTLYETMNPFIPEKSTVYCHGGGSFALLDRLSGGSRRIPFAFVDGKHAYEFVRREGLAIADMQRLNDIVLFDDCQIPEVHRAVTSLLSLYTVSYIEAGPRKYAIARRK